MMRVFIAPQAATQLTELADQNPNQALLELWREVQKEQNESRRLQLVKIHEGETQPVERVRFSHD